MGQRQPEFSEEDQLSPVYCPRCKRHIPRASFGEYPYCPECMAEVDRQRRQRQAEAEAVAAAEAQRQEAERKRIYESDTGMGSCPQCGSRNLRQFATGGTDSTAQAATCCFGCLFFWPLMLLAPFLFRRPSELHRVCNACGYAWRA